jgi:ABC-type nitrate/sulfonate/bicarbonate transport system substrate-binding protein
MPSRSYSALFTAAASCVLVVVAFFVPARAWAADTLHVGKAVPPDFGYTVVNVGVAAGTFARHGLQVEPIDFAGAPKLHQAMLAGSIEIGLSGGPDMIWPSSQKARPNSRSPRSPTSRAVSKSMRATALAFPR